MEPDLDDSLKIDGLRNYLLLFLGRCVEKWKIKESQSGTLNCDWTTLTFVKIGSMRSEKEKSATDWVLSLYRLVAHFKLLLSFSSLQTWCEFSHPWEHKKQESQDRNFEPECCVIYKNANLESSSLAHLSLWCEKHFIYLFFLNARLVISL